MGFISDRFWNATHIVFCVFLDAVIFCFWLLIAWATRITAEFFEVRGAPTVCAYAFFWIATVGTLILVVIYIVHDIIFALKEIINNWETQPEEEDEEDF